MFAAFVNGYAMLYADGDGAVEIDDATWLELPEGFDPDVSAARLIDGEVEVAPVDVVREELFGLELRIASLLPQGVDALTQDFTLLPLRKTSPEYEKGRKVQAEYLGDDNQVAVRKTFFDLDGQDGRLTGLMIRFEWFCNNGDVGLEKTHIVREYTPAEAETVTRERRERQIDSLVAGAKGTPIAPIFDKVLTIYSDAITDYIASGSDLLASAIAEDERAESVALLDVVIGQQPDGSPYTIRHAILRELT